jgi:hypothetical protein
MNLESLNYNPFAEPVTALANDHSRATCSICFELLWEPRKTPCNHYFCERCIVPHVDTDHDCPLCRQPIPNKYKLQRISDELYDFNFKNLLVKCPTAPACPWIGPNQKMTFFTDACKQVPTAMFGSTFAIVAAKSR